MLTISAIQSILLAFGTPAVGELFHGPELGKSGGGDRGAKPSSNCSPSAPRPVTMSGSQSRDLLDAGLLMKSFDNHALQYCLSNACVRNGSKSSSTLQTVHSLTEGPGSRSPLLMTMIKMAAYKWVHILKQCKSKPCSLILRSGRAKLSIGSLT